MSDQFNGDYYVTVATVVPLLYITLFLQGELMQDFTKKIAAVAGKQVAAMIGVVDSWYHGKFKLVQIWTLVKGYLFTGFFFSFFVYVLFAIVLAGPVAAGYAVWALFYHSDVFYMRMITMLSTIGLLVLVISGPAAVIIRNAYMPILKVTKEYVDAQRKEVQSHTDETGVNGGPHEGKRATGLGWPPNSSSTAPVPPAMAQMPPTSG